MDENVKRRFDALEELRKAAWQSFDSRRSAEWKIGITLWTALAAFIGVVLTGRITASGFGAQVLVLVIAGLVLLLHIHFIRGVARAQGADRKIEYFHRAEMMRLVDVEFPAELQEELQAIGERTGTLKSWSHTFQVGVTLILATGAVVAVLLAV